MFSTFQPGHGWVAQGGSVWNTDTIDYEYGSQSVVTTITNGSINNFRRIAAPTADLSGKNFAMLVKVTDPAALYRIDLYLGSGGFANFEVLTAAVGGNASGGVASGIASATSSFPGNAWRWVYFSWADKTSQSGTPNRTTITDWQIRVTANTGAGFTTDVHLGAIAHYTKPTTYSNGVVSIACDDSYVSQFTTLRPILDAYGYAATAFAIVDRLGTSGRMTQANLDQLQDAHGWEPAGHAFTDAAHNAGLTALTAGALETELRSLRDWLKRYGYRGADLFAYPQGDENAAVRATVGRYFSLARQTVRTPMGLTHLDQPLRTRSTSISSAVPDTQASMKVQVDNAYANGTWLIITVHDLVASGASAGTQWLTSDFQGLTDYIATKGIPVEPVGAVLDRVSAAG